MRKCDNCLNKDFCSQKIYFTNEFGMIDQKQISLCSEYEKNIELKYDLTELYTILFKYREVLTIYREEFYGILQDTCGETKLYLIINPNINRQTDIEIREKIYNFKTLYNLELIYGVFNEQTFKNTCKNKELEKIERNDIL